MAKLKLFSTIFSKLSSLIKKDGQVIISKDSQSLYIDIDGERVEITDWVDINTEEELLATLSPLANKFYYTKDTHKIWRYINSKWEKLNTVVTWETIEGKPDNLAYIGEDSEVVDAEMTAELTTSDIVDNLTTEDSTKVLSATQGKILNDNVNTLNSNLEKWIPAKNIYIKSDTENDSVLTISTDNPNSDWNKPCRVYQKSDGSAVRNMPSIFPQGTGFVGIRYVDYFNEQNICIRLLEISPVMGRVWIRKYNGSAWGNWTNDNMGKTHSTTAAMLTPIALNANITFTDGVGTLDISEYLEKAGLGNASGACFAMLRGSSTSTQSVRKCICNTSTKIVTIVASNHEGSLFSGTADVSVQIFGY